MLALKCGKGLMKGYSKKNGYIEKAEATETRDKLLHDMMNSSVMGALIGGFALGNLTSHDLSTDIFFDKSTY